MLTAAERQEIDREVDRILRSELFQKSERCTKLLRYLANETLAADFQRLKERRVGHEVFGREPGYDTAADPIVRNVASGVRKRIHQYYEESGSPSEVRIELPSGSYVLDFHFRHAVKDGFEADIPESAIFPTSLKHDRAGLSLPSGLEPLSQFIPAWYGTKFLLASALTALVFAGALLLLIEHVWHLRDQPRPTITSSDPFWGPVLALDKEVFIVIGHAIEPGAEPPMPVPGLQLILMTDVTAFSTVSRLLASSGQTFQTRPDNLTTMQDLKNHPVVLIGGENNSWTRRLTANLRYRFDSDEAHTEMPQRKASITDWIRPNVRLWEAPVAQRTSPRAEGYAIAGRFKDATTGSIVVYVAGAGPVATEAASNFISQKRFLATLPEILLNPEKDVLILVKTEILDGVPGPPTMVATYIW